MSETSDAVDPHQRQRRRSLITIGVVLLGLFFAFWYAWSYYQAETEAVAAPPPAAPSSPVDPQAGRAAATPLLRQWTRRLPPAHAAPVRPATSPGAGR